MASRPEDLASPDTLVLVHMVCIGWLGMALCGALLQFVPVLVSELLFAKNFALPAFVLLAVGLVALLSGLLALGGRLPPWLWLLPFGASLLVVGFGLIAIDVAPTIRRAASLGNPGALRASPRCSPWSRSAPTLPRGLPDMAALRSISFWRSAFRSIRSLVFGGSLTLTAMGVSYRLLAMFMLSPDSRAMVHFSSVPGTNPGLRCVGSSRFSSLPISTRAA